MIDSGQWVDIDAELGEVLSYALSLAEDSGGAYDVTVGPLVNLWGFGPDPARRGVPDAAALESARTRVGWRKVEVDASEAPRAQGSRRARRSLVARQRPRRRPRRGISRCAGRH